MGSSYSTIEHAPHALWRGIEWEEPVCLLCGGFNSEPVIEAPDPTGGKGALWFLVVRCRDCGLCFTSPRPTASHIGRFYPSDYQPHQKTHGRLSLWRRCLDRCTGNYRKVLPLHGKGRLLDFGCGGGSYLHRMKQQGWQVTGIDASEDAVARIRAELELPAFVGTLPHPDLEPESFDVITMWQALEHVHWPLEVLTAARDLLAPEGKLIVAVPNIDSLPFRWFGRAWHGLELPRHLTHFTPRTLGLMLQRAGFQVSSIRMVRHPSWLRTSAKRAIDNETPTQWQRLLRGRVCASLASWLAYLTRQADCMMVTAAKR